jgi:hypothetical protein
MPNEIGHLYAQPFFILLEQQYAKLLLDAGTASIIFCSYNYNTKE